MITSLLLLALQAVPEGGQASPTVEVGRYRHVQALKPGPGGELRFATTGLLAPVGDDGRWSSAKIRSGFIEIVTLGSDGGIETEARVAVSGNPIRGFSWTESPTWRVLEHTSWTGLVHVEPGDRDRVRCVDISGDLSPAGSFAGGEIYDVRTEGKQSQLLVRNGATVARVFITSGARAAFESMPITAEAAGLDAVIAATYEADPADPARRRADAWLIGLADGNAQLIADPGDTEEPQLQFALALDGLDGPTTRTWLAATTVGDRAWVAIGQQAYGRSAGRVTVFSVDSGMQPTRRWSAMGEDSFAGLDWGHDVRFVPDADGDGVPDLIVAGPWKIGGTSWTDLLSARTGKRLARWDPGVSGPSTGHTVSLVPGTTTVLLGCAAGQDYPETFSSPGVLAVLDSADLTLTRIVKERGHAFRGAPSAVR